MRVIQHLTHHANKCVCSVLFLAYLLLSLLCVPTYYTKLISLFYSSNCSCCFKIKDLSRAITFEKFSTYLGEQEQLSPDEIIASAKRLMLMHKEGLKFGKSFVCLSQMCLILLCKNSSSSPIGGWESVS